ncbi:hypothetical protein FS842_000105 [Serendipita sp. 407]|nr:hypothetical protein FS842_000105 [Serendipita sp. 407]
MNDSSSTNSKPDLDPTVNLVAGTVAGLSGLIIGFPFDTVKTRFQDIRTAGRYAGTSDAFKTIIKEEGVSGMFKGIQAPMLGCAVLSGLVFGAYGYLLQVQLQPHQREPNLLQTYIAGLGSGVVSSFITTPSETVKIRQQITVHTKPPSAWQIAQQIYREKGTRGLFRGYTPTAIRESGYGVYFLTYEAITRYFRTPRQSGGGADAPLLTVPWYGVLIAGGIAGPMSWIFTFPSDVVKTRMQALPVEPAISHSSSSSSISTAKPPRLASSKALFSSASGGQTVDTMVASVMNGTTVRGASQSVSVFRELNTWETVVDCYRREGPRIFWAGLTPTLIRAVPVNIVTFGAFEVAVSLLTNGK